MVVEMMKYSFLIYHQEYTQFLEDIRNLGVVHVIEKGVGSPQEESDLQQMLQSEARIKKVVTQLCRLMDETTTLAAATTEVDYPTLLARYDELLEQIAKEQHQQAALQKEIARVEVWGDYNRDNIDRLVTAGYEIGFYSCSASNFDPEWVTRYNAIMVAEEGSTHYFVTVTQQGEEVNIESADQVRMPELSLGEMQQALTNSRNQEERIAAERKAFGESSIMSLELAAVRLREEFDYMKVQLNTEKQADNMLMLLEGWVSVDKVEEVNSFLDSKSVYYQANKPTKADNVPIKLKNNAFTRLFEVIGELYDMPNYHEMDLTPFFAPFFVMFFGLCLGDAGYGLLITIGALIARSKVDEGLKPFMTLATILGIGTVIFGTMSGTLFGINLLNVEWAWVKNLKAMMLDADQLFNFALGVGVCQIVFGMVLRVIGSTKRHGFMNSLSHWGWLILIVGCGGVFAAQTMGVLSAEAAKIGFYIAGGVGAVGIFLLNDMKRNPLINVGAGLWDTYNMATGLLGDLLSYIRLFALGISGSVMGLVFNDLAISMTKDMPIVIAQIVMIAILLAGHGMNIFMNGLGAFVHPMRLTFVEFYKNAGFEGGGKKYTPFARTNQLEK